MNDGFVDIHCHVLPGLDDGPASLEESLKMLEVAKEDGIVGIVAAPHIMDGVYNNTKEGISKAVARLAQEANAPRLYSGADIRIGRNLIQRMGKKELPLINDKNYLLLELPTYSLPPLREIENIVHCLRVRGITPIVTHPERNFAMLNDTGVIERLIGCGAAFQVTAMSIAGKLGNRVQKAVFGMIKKGYVHLVASDAHDPVKRPPVLSGAYEEVSRKFGNDEAHRLFRINPLAVVNGETLQ